MLRNDVKITLVTLLNRKLRQGKQLWGIYLDGLGAGT